MDEQKKSAAESAHEALSEIANDAFEKTGGDVWRAGQPLASEPGAQSPPSQPAAETNEGEKPAPPQPETKPAEPTSETPSKFLGKYNSLEEAERGYHEAVRMGNEAKANADALQMRLAAIERTLNPQAPTAAETDPLEEFESLGIPKDVAERVISSVSTKVVQKMFEPAMKKIEADQKIVQLYPDYQTNFDAINSFVEGDSGLKAQVEELVGEGKHLVARQVAYLNWKIAQATTTEETLKTKADERAKDVKEARKDAGVGGTRGSDTRTAAQDTGPTAEDKKRALELLKAGHPAPFHRMALDPWLPPDFDKMTESLGG